MEWLWRLRRWCANEKRDHPNGVLHYYSEDILHTVFVLGVVVVLTISVVTYFTHPQHKAKTTCDRLADAAAQQATTNPADAQLTDDAAFDCYNQDNP